MTRSLLPRLPSRTRLALTAALALALVASCGQSPQAAPGPAATDATTVQVEYNGYTATIPADPQRVVVLDSRSSLELAILAGYPIVALDYDETSHLASQVPADAARFGGEISKEAVLSHDPDLILVSSGWYEHYLGEGIDFSEIAPVLVVQDESTPVTAGDEGRRPPLELASEQLALIGKQDRADQAEEDYATALRDAVAEVGDVARGRTVVFVSLLDDNYYVFDQPTSLLVDVATDLGYTILQHPTIDEVTARSGAAYAVELSWEQAGVLDGADLVVAQNLSSWTGNAAWDAVPAVVAGHVTELSYDNKVGFGLTYQDFLAKLVEQTRTLAD